MNDRALKPEPSDEPAASPEPAVRDGARPRRWRPSPGVAALALVLLLFDLFAAARAFPENTNLPGNEEHERGDVDRRVERIFRMARDRADQPFFDVKDHLLFHGHNPGLFIFVAETFVRLGATSPVPNQILCILLWNAGLIFFFLWTRAAASSELFAASATLFLLTTPFLLFHSGSIHADSYTFVFFNLTLFLFTRYLERLERRWLVLTLLAYFLTCESYWMYYVSLYLMLVALQVKAGQVRLKVAALLAVPPVLAAGLVILQAAYAGGALGRGFHVILDVAVARSGDWRISGSEWSPDDRFLDPEEKRHYAAIVAERIHAMSGVPLWAIAAAFGATLVMSWRRALRHHGWLLVALVAGLSWNMIMIQHTVIHGFSGMYGYFFWAVVAGSFCQELYESLRPTRARRALAVLAVPAVLALLADPYASELAVYLTNLSR